MNNIKENFENFKKKAKLLHEDNFEYDKVHYINSFTKVEIFCKKCNNYFFSSPGSHLQNKKFCCTKCNSRLPYTKESFSEKANKIYNNKYNYDLVEFKIYQKKVIIVCPIHNNFEQNFKSHLKGIGCNKCIIEQKELKRKNKFIEEANKKYNFKYDYSKVKYKSNITNIKIICPIHQEFEQAPVIHLKPISVGCPKCSYSLSPFKKSEWIKKAGNREGTFYIIRCWNKNEEFYKFGITFTNTETRYGNHKDLSRISYDYEIIREVKSFDLAYIWDLEKRFKHSKIKQHYNPLIYFRGCKYECFKNIK